MAGKPVRMPEDTLAWYERATRDENAQRRKRRLTPIEPTDLLRYVVNQFAGLPVALEIDLDALQARMRESESKRQTKHDAKVSPFITTPPNPPIGKARKPKSSAS